MENEQDFKKEWGHIDWDYTGLSYNPNVTFEFVMKNKHKKWDNVISRGRNIDPVKVIEELLKDKHESYWSWEELEKNPNLTIEIMSKYNDHHQWKRLNNSEENYSEIKHINIGDIESLQEHVQIVHNLSVDQSATFDDINSSEIKKDINYTYFSYNYNLTKKIFLENKNINWSFSWFCSNPSINPIINGKDVFSIETYNALKRKGYNMKCIKKEECVECKTINYCTNCKNCFKCNKVYGNSIQYNHFTPYIKKWHDIFSNALNFLIEDIRNMVLDFIMS